MAVSRASGKQILVPQGELRSLVAGIFEALGTPRRDAEIVASVLVEADLRGIESHGVGRVRLYVKDIRNGIVLPRTTVEVVKDSPSIAIVEGNNGLGQVVAHRAMEMCIRKALATGCASVAVRGSNHYGIAGYYAMMALEHDLIGLSLTNSSPVTVPTHASKAVIGSNPIALAIPAGQERPYVLDMATSVVPLGKMEVMMRTGQEIPLGWGVDRAGRPTTDPAEAYWYGGLMPLGGIEEMRGYKGYGLSLAVDVFSAVLSGACFASQIIPWQNVRTEAANLGHFFSAWKVDAFMPQPEFKARMDELIQLMRQAPKAEGQERIYIPGEKEYEIAEQRQREGIPVHPEVAETLAKIGAELGVDCTVLERA
jgi:LDH2 family malate/lactate/ureidoglycolate dehydrogenase